MKRLPTKPELFGCLALAAIVGSQLYSLVDFSQRVSSNKVERARLTAFAVAPETIRLSTAGATVDLTHYKGGRGQTPGWTLLRTKDWAILVDGEDGGSICKPVLHDFIAANTPRWGWSASSLRSIDAFMSKHRNSTVDAQVFVPRPAQAPRALATCPGMGYDAERKLLTFEGRAVAVWSSKQPYAASKDAPHSWSVPRYVY